MNIACRQHVNVSCLRRLFWRVVLRSCLRFCLLRVLFRNRPGNGCRHTCVVGPAVMAVHNTGTEIVFGHHNVINVRVPMDRGCSPAKQPAAMKSC